MAEDLNTVDPARPPRSKTAGDVPEPIRRRYLTEARGGPGLGFYVDARIETAAFRDHGGRLATDRNDPQVVRDLVAIAQHRGWTAIDVRGHTEFRRQVWLAARAAGLDVRGYRPTERDQQEAARRLRPREPAAPTPPDARARLQVVEAVVRNRVVEPSEQARILAAARARLAHWLERGASFVDRTPPARDRPR